MKRLDAAIRLLVTGLGYFAASLIVPLTLVTCWEVFARHALGAPTSWSFEIGYMLTGTYFLLAGAYALRVGAHIRIDVLYARFSPRVQSLIDFLFMLILLAPMLFLLSWTLFDYTLDAFESGRTTGKSSWNPPAWPFRFVMFISMLALFLEVVSITLRNGFFLLSDKTERTS